MAPEQRTRVTMAVVGISVLAASGVGFLLSRRSLPPAIVITAPQGDPPPAISGGGSYSAPIAQAPTKPYSAPPATSSVHPDPPPTDAGPLAVDVSGAVRNPTLYYLPQGSRVQQAIYAAGGPTSNADLDLVNLAEKLTDGEKVYIPRKGLTTDAPVTDAGNTIGELAPTGAESSSAVESGSASRGSSGHGHSSNKLTSPVDGQIDLNTATAEQLQQVPGIGPAMSARIIAYRQQSGPFHSIDDLRQVSGVGEKKLAKWMPFLAVH